MSFIRGVRLWTIALLVSFAPFASAEVRSEMRSPESDPFEYLLQTDFSIEPASADYNLICKSIGRSAHGTFTVNGRTYSKKVRVGVAADGCWGRCGPGCDGRAVYTQECLNHDVCYSATGDVMGECSDEFWAAASGFMNGPNCY